MGIIRMGPPEDIVLYLKDLFKIKTFIETGTFHGRTSLWASKNFDEVKTIEFSEKIFSETQQKYSDVPNVEFIFGDTRTELRKIVDKLTCSAIFWLDAHWCGMDSYGENDPCPLIDEINIINTSKLEHFILIDDARLFITPPPLPIPVKYYPDLNKIISTLHLKKERYSCIYEDVIITIPSFSSELFINFMQKKTTDDWQKHDTISKKENNSTTNRIIKKIIKTLKHN